MNRKNTSFDANGKREIKCGSRIFTFEKPLVMGVLNVTPDSFYDGGKYGEEKALLLRVEKMIEEGVDILDLGGMSTRPGAKMVTGDEEVQRVLPSLKRIKKAYPDLPVSIDTFRSKVAEVCVENGADMINDISGGTMDDNMFETVAKLKVPYVMMHIKGTPETMQEDPVEKNIVMVVKSFFWERVHILNELGFYDIILDPGFGFGKTLECNYRLLNEMENVRFENLPLLAGISRKSMINKVLGTTPDEALNGTTALNTLALMNGADILRVHDVKEAVQAVELFTAYKKGSC
jgi:dihydropteroate synthase